MAQAMPTYTVMSIVDIVMSTAMSTILSTIMCIAFELIYLLSGSQFLEPDGWLSKHVPHPLSCPTPFELMYLFSGSATGCRLWSLPL